MINPNVVEGQIAGGVVQGIGGALFEHLAYDDDGNPLATTFMDYLCRPRPRCPMHRVRAHRDAEPRPGRLQGRRRRRRDRRAAGRRQRGGRRALAVRRDGDAPAAEPVAHRRAPRSARPASEVHRDQYDRRLLRPLRRRDQRRSVSGVPPAARRGAALLQRAVRLLRGQPLRRRRARPQGPRDVHLRARRDPRADQGRTSRCRPASSSSRTRRSTPCTAGCCRGCSPRRR